MDVCLIEVAEKIVWRKWIKVYGSEIVDVTTRDFVVNAVDVRLADVDGLIAGVGDSVVVAVIVGVALGFFGLAFEDPGEAAASWLAPIVQGSLVG